MSREIVHMIGENGAKLTINGPDVRTRCGIIACPVGANVGPTKYSLIDKKGNTFFGTTRAKVVSCRKCLSLLTDGTLQPKRDHNPGEQHD